MPTGIAHLGAMVEDEATLTESFRMAMLRVASTVNVISIHVDGQPMGVTATAVSALSLDPPSLLVCLNRAASLHAPSSTQTVVSR